ncbi:hypothetical protein [Methylobacterium frigidaeris]|uniref:hypothetical protein n=1 Tax=Methylobacterium frigidaeris TaxID=2038277 RepID=UPI001EDCD57A|nr:hypothetical protein [Methylobacterium frigidaeris]
MTQAAIATMPNIRVIVRFHSLSRPRSVVTRSGDQTDESARPQGHVRYRCLGNGRLLGAGLQMLWPHRARQMIARRLGGAVEGAPVEVPEKRREIGSSTSEVSAGSRISTGMSVQVNRMFPAAVEEATHDPSSSVGTQALRSRSRAWSGV